MNNNVYAPPSSDVQDLGLPYQNHLGLAGFWRRLAASILDGIFILLVTLPLSFLMLGSAYFDDTTTTFFGPMDFVINYLLPFIIVMAFWKLKGATPGKMALGIKIIRAKDEDPLSTGQCIGRYFGYFLSAIPIGLGYFWMLWDDKKQTWHDKLAGTLVVRTR